MDNKEFFAALEAMEEERGIPKEFLADKIADAIVVAARKDFGGREIVSCIIDHHLNAIPAASAFDCFDVIVLHFDLKRSALEFARSDCYMLSEKVGFSVGFVNFDDGDTVIAIDRDSIADRVAPDRGIS